MTNIISVQNLSVERNQQFVLSDVSINIAPRSFNFIVGGNGSGKSTLIKAILGIVQPQSGKVLINTELNTQQVVAKYIGYVPQSTTIDRSFPISVSEMIQLECSRSERCAHGLNHHLELLGSDHLLDKKLSNLSGGEFQKVLIARALVTDPQIIILDEPTNNLDSASQTELYALLREQNELGKTIIIITHDYQTIEHTTDSIWMVSDQAVRAVSLAELFDQKLIEHHHHD